MAASLIGGAYGANQLLLVQSHKLVTIRSEEAALEKQQVQLRKAKANVTKYDSISQVARSVVPQDKSQAQTVRELVKIADKNNIKLASITFPSSTLGVGAVPGAGAGTGAAGASAGAATPVPTNSKTSDLSQLLPVKTISGLYTLQISIQSDPTISIPYDKFIAFLSDLEANRRTALVSNIALIPDTKDPTKVSFILNLDEYVKP